MNAPDATTLLKFRCLMIEHELTRRLLDEIDVLPHNQGLPVKEAPRTHTTIIKMPQSTQNIWKNLDQELHQTTKGKKQHVEMKTHSGVDADSGPAHGVVGTMTNVSDVPEAHTVLQGRVRQEFADAGYISVDKREKMGGKTVKWHVAAKRRKTWAMPEEVMKGLVIAVRRTRAQIRSRIEYPFHIVKNLFIARANTKT